MRQLRSRIIVNERSVLTMFDELIFFVSGENRVVKIANQIKSNQIILFTSVLTNWGRPFMSHLILLGLWSKVR